MRRSDDHNLTSDLVAGLLAGVAATWALDRIDWFMWNRQPPAARARTHAARPGGKDPAHVLADRISSALPTPLSDRQEKAGDVIHWLIGLAPAPLYAVLRDRVPAVGAGRGALFGMGLFLAQDEGLNTITGLGGKPSDYPWQDHARGLIAHTVYGLTLDFALNLLQGRRN